MNKTERIAEIKRRYEDDGQTFAEIINAEDLGVTSKTIKGDLLALYPEDDEAINAAGTHEVNPPNDGDGNTTNPAPGETNGENVTPTPPAPKAEEAKTDEAEAEPELSAGDKEYTRLTVEAITFDTETGEPMGKPFTHTVNRRTWPQFIKNHKGTGLTVLTVDHLAPGLKPFPFGDYDKKTQVARARVMKFRKIQG